MIQIHKKTTKKNGKLTATNKEDQNPNKNNNQFIMWLNYFIYTFILYTGIFFYIETYYFV